MASTSPVGIATTAATAADDLPPRSHTSEPTLSLKSASVSLDQKSGVVDYNSATFDTDLVDPDENSPRLTDWFFRRNNNEFDLDTIATKRSVYDDPILAKHYWPKESYENLHRFDPNARWTNREEKVGSMLRQVQVTDASFAL